MFLLCVLSQRINTQFGPCVQSPQLGLKMNPPPIQEKPAKSTKKAPPTKEELQKMTVSRFYFVPAVPLSQGHVNSLPLFFFLRRRWSKNT